MVLNQSTYSQTEFAAQQIYSTKISISLIISVKSQIQIKISFQHLANVESSMVDWILIACWYCFLPSISKHFFANQLGNNPL